MAKTIRVTGRANLSVSPDTTVLRIELRGEEKSYSQIMERASSDLKKIKESIAALGFKEGALKNQSFDVDADYESQKDKKGNYKRVFVGYEYYRRMTLKFPKDAARLYEVMCVLMTCGAAPEISINYTVLDTESPKNQLLELAVKDSICKARTLAKGAQVELGDIVSIDYSFVKFEIETPRILADKCATFGLDDADLDFDLDPEDIELCDNVTVVFEIK